MSVSSLDCKPLEVKACTHGMYLTCLQNIRIWTREERIKGRKGRGKEEGDEGGRREETKKGVPSLKTSGLFY